MMGMNFNTHQALEGGRCSIVIDGWVLFLIPVDKWRVFSRCFAMASNVEVGIIFNTRVGSGSAYLRVWMQPLRGWVSFSIPDLRGDVLFRMRELVLMDGYRFRYPRGERELFLSSKGANRLCVGMIFNTHQALGEWSRCGIVIDVWVSFLIPVLRSVEGGLCCFFSLFVSG